MRERYKPPTILRPEQESTIIAWLAGDITMKDVGSVLGITQGSIPTVILNIIKKMHEDHKFQICKTPPEKK